MDNDYKSQSRAAYYVLALLMAVLAVRCFLSFCQTDESYYMAVIHRFWQGERPVCDEWGSSQFYSLLLLPFYGLYMALNGSTEGTLLFLRLLYVGFAGITGLSLFRTLLRSGQHPFCALSAAAVLLLYSRANISGVSYYNFCMLCSASAFCAFVRAEKGVGRVRAVWFGVTGVLQACAVLADPMLAPFVVLAILAALARKKHREDALFCLAGICAMAALYCAYLLRVTGLKEMILNFPYLLENPEQVNVASNLLIACQHMISACRYVLLPAVLKIAMDRRKLSETQQAAADRLYFYVQAILLIWTAYRTLNGTLGAICIPVTAAAFPLFLKATREHQSHENRILYLTGLINAAAYAAASNTAMDAATVGFCLSAAAGLALLWEMIEKTEWNDSLRCIVTGFFVLALLVPMFSQRVIGVYRDAPIAELTVKLSQGPAKGLYTTPEHAHQYEEICDTLIEFQRTRAKGRILFSKNLPWAYVLMDSYGCASSSPWRSYTDELLKYYRVHPENTADYICILDEAVGAWDASPLNRNQAQSRPNAFDYSEGFWKRLLEQPAIVETEWLKIYDGQSFWPEEMAK